MSIFSFDLLNQSGLFSWTEHRHCVLSQFNINPLWPIVPRGNLSSGPCFPCFHMGQASWQTFFLCTTVCDSNGEPYGLVRGDFVLHNRRQNFAEGKWIFYLKNISHNSQPAFFKSNIVRKARKGEIGLQVYFWKFCVCEKSWNSKS